MLEDGFQKYHSDIETTVKWFNSHKGFGWVQVSDGSPDAFLHASVVERSGVRDLAGGTVLFCEIAPGPKGPEVAKIHFVDMATTPMRQSRAQPAKPNRRRFR